MSQKKFGKIVKSLRQEQVDYQSGRFWTQKNLAEAAYLSENIIGNIEQGRRISLTSNELRQLADALRLSTLEKQEFFMAGTSTYQDSYTVDKDDVQESFDTIWNKFAMVQQPSYLTDSLSSLIGINEPMMLFHGITPEILDKNRQSEAGCNILSLFFRPDSPLKNAMGHRWYSPALSNVRQFQFTALQYRHTSRFEKTLSLLYSQPDFHQIWQQSRSQPIDTFSMVREFDYAHIKHGPVHYIATVTPTITPYGPLYMTVFVACSPRTQIIFNDLVQNKISAQKIMSWSDSINI